MNTGEISLKQTIIKRVIFSIMILKIIIKLTIKLSNLIIKSSRFMIKTYILQVMTILQIQFRRQKKIMKKLTSIMILTCIMNNPAAVKNLIENMKIAIDLQVTNLLERTKHQPKSV